jgi:hypothetical protein
MSAEQVKAFIKQAADASRMIDNCLCILVEDSSEVWTALLRDDPIKVAIH